MQNQLKKTPTSQKTKNPNQTKTNKTKPQPLLNVFVMGEKIP